MGNMNQLETKSLMRDVAQNAANISIIMNRLDEQTIATKQILTYIENDPMTGRRGLFKTQEDHEHRIDKIEVERSNEKTKQKIYIGIATTIGAAVMTLGSFLFDIIFKK